LFVFRETETGYDDKAIPHFPSFSTAQESQVIKALPRKPTGNPPQSTFAAWGDTDEYCLLFVDEAVRAPVWWAGAYLRNISGSRCWLCYRKSVSDTLADAVKSRVVYTLVFLRSSGSFYRCLYRSPIAFVKRDFLDLLCGSAGAGWPFEPSVVVSLCVCAPRDPPGSVGCFYAFPATDRLLEIYRELFLWKQAQTAKSTSLAPATAFIPPPLLLRHSFHLHTLQCRLVCVGFEDSTPSPRQLQNSAQLNDEER
jgi:hypothetical protein